MTVHPRRIVCLEAGYDTSRYEWFQANYLHPVERRLYPSTDLYVGDELVFQTNSHGCKGAEPEPGQKLLGVFGDSVVQGGNMASFVDHVHIPGYATLNGGIEGSTLRPTVSRFIDFHARYPLDAVAVHTGWHNLIYDEHSEPFWIEQLDRVQGPPVIAHFTLVADINPQVIEVGYDQLFRDGVYAPWGAGEGLYADKARLLDFYERIRAFNAFIRDYCERRGRVLIDLEPVLAPRSYTEVSTRFLDLIHPRPRVYPQIGAAVAAALAPALGGAHAPAPVAPASNRPGSRAIPQTGRNYPLW